MKLNKRNKYGGAAVKILHTGDWHIGKIVNQIHMTHDQEYILEALVMLLKSERPDVLVVTGDIYDRAIPPVEAVELLDKTLSRILLELNIPVLMIAGNHDSPDRLGFGSQLLRTKGLHIAGRLSKDIHKVVIADAYGPVNFYLVPYASPAVVRDVLECDDICDHDTAMKAIIANIQTNWNVRERNILVTHGFIRGVEELELSESEKPLSITLAVGGTDYVDVKHFAGFTYTALGHLHGPQTAGSERVRYSGSLLKYSFSEARQCKSVTLVQIGKDGELTVECQPITPLRDMRRLKGTMKELLDPVVYATTNVNDYLHVTLTDEGELIEPMSKLRTVYPNVLSLDFQVQERQVGESKTAAGEGHKHKTKLELFSDFYTAMTGLEFNLQKVTLAAQTISTAEAEDRGA
jgi:exonuclease SbcD